MPNPEDITDPTTAINMALALMAKAFKLNYSTPTNNNQRISSNPRNRQITQPGKNMGQDRQMQMVGGYSECCSESKISKYWKSEWEEARIQLQAEEFDLMAAVADLDEIKEVNANCILIANLQQASTSGTQSDKAPVYDSDGSAEVHDYENCNDNEIFNMFTQEEQYTELLEPIPDQHQVPQNDNNVISEVTSVEQSGEIVEQHHVNFEETRALYDSLYHNLAIEVKKVNSVNRKLKETNVDLTTELARFKNQEKPGSESRPPMLNKENYVSWSFRLLRYAKSKPNEKLIHNSIINGPYVRRMIPEPGDTNRLPEDIYAAVDSCETAQEIWLKVQQMMKGSDIGIQEKKAKLFNEWERFTSNEGESIESYYHPEVHDYENCDDNEIFNMFTQEERYTELLEPIPEPHQVPQNDHNVISKVTSVEQSGETVEQHPANFEETQETLQLAQESHEKMKQLNKEIKAANYTKINHLSGVFVSQTAKSHEELYFQMISKRPIMSLETHNWSSSAHQELYKIVRDENFPIVNQVNARVQNFEIQFLKEAAKFVGDFKSLAKEADDPLAKHKALELEIERLLRVVVSQDIMSVVQKESVVDTSNLQTEL
uniref:Gag-Pol polyprotein n=1 Tax=Tanacetum cinerariifolium TaxID=118510 RepID=A0A6L2J553_TANCI|nr:hypothetical protein [Tanacetum cinerariifolium]